MLIPYIEKYEHMDLISRMYIPTYEHMGLISRKPLNPTGRWKIESGPYYTNKMFVEHKGWIFKYWIDEDDICFRSAPKIDIFKCK